VPQRRYTACRRLEASRAGRPCSQWSPTGGRWICGAVYQASAVGPLSVPDPGEKFSPRGNRSCAMPHDKMGMAASDCTLARDPKMGQIAQHRKARKKFKALSEKWLRNLLGAACGFFGEEEHAGIAAIAIPCRGRTWIKQGAAARDGYER